MVVLPHHPTVVTSLFSWDFVYYSEDLRGWGTFVKVMGTVEGHPQPNIGHGSSERTKRTQGFGQYTIPVCRRETAGFQSGLFLIMDECGKL